MKKPIRAVVVALASLAAGCAMNSAGPSFAELKPAEARADAALVYVVRYHAEPLAIGAAIWLDDARVVELFQKGFTRFYAPPGKHTIRARWGVLSGQHPSDIELELEAGQTYYLELVGVSRGAGDWIRVGSRLNRLGPAGAESKLAVCRYQRPTKGGEAVASDTQHLDEAVKASSQPPQEKKSEGDLQGPGWWAPGSHMK